MNLWIHVLIILVPLLKPLSADKLLLEKRVLDDLFAGYDSRIRPHGKNGTGPVVIEVNTYVRDISRLDDSNMEYAAQLTFRQSWQDERLKYDSQGLKYVTLTDPHRLWTPDLFFSNEKKGHLHTILTPNVLVRIYPDGRVFYSTRVSLQLSCPMDLRNYPMDRQVCNIVAASYGYTTDDIVFRWKAEDPVQISRSLTMLKFDLDRFYTEYCDSRTSTGLYSCIMLKFELTRVFTSYMLYAFMPTLFLVILSWVPFWLHPHSIAVRVGIWIGVLISMVIVTTCVAENTPHVSYTKAIDWWMGTCVFFIFCVLIELALVNNALTKENRETRGKTIEKEDKMMSTDDEAQNNSNRLPTYSFIPLKWLNKYSTQAQRIDAVSRILFPASFAFFNFVYWLTYTVK